MQTAREFVEVAKACRDSCDRTFVLKEFLDRFKSAHHLLFHREHLAFEPVFADGEDSLFYFIENIIYFVLFLVGPSNALCGRRDDLAENMFVSDDVEVVLHVRCRRHEREEGSDKGGATDRIKQIPIT